MRLSASHFRIKGAYGRASNGKHGVILKFGGLTYCRIAPSLCETEGQE